MFKNDLIHMDKKFQEFKKQIKLNKLGGCAAPNRGWQLIQILR